MESGVFEKNGTKLTVKPERQMDLEYAPELEKEMKPYLEEVQEVVMDFSNVSRITPAGFEVLLATARQLFQRGGSIRVIHANQRVVDDFNLVNFTEVMAVESD